MPRLRPARLTLALLSLAPLGLALLAGCAGASAEGRARVAIHCEEPSAELTVDGVPRGIASDYAGPHRLLLAQGPHVLELKGPGFFETRRLMVGPEDDLTVTVAR